MAASNFQITVLSDRRAHFDAALKLAFADAAGGNAFAYSIDTKEGLTLYWDEKEVSATPLAYGMRVEEATNFAWGFLKNSDYTKYDPGPYDGDVGYKKGFIIKSISTNSSAFVTIKPVYTEYHK